MQMLQVKNTLRQQLFRHDMAGHTSILKVAQTTNQRRKPLLFIAVGNHWIR